MKITLFLVITLIVSIMALIQSLQVRNIGRHIYRPYFFSFLQSTGNRNNIYITRKVETTLKAAQSSVEIGSKVVTASIIRNLELMNADSVELKKLSSAIKDSNKPTVVIFLRHLG